MFLLVLLSSLLSILHFVHSGSQITRFIDYDKRLRSVCPVVMNQHPSLWEEGCLSYNYPVSLVTPQRIGVSTSSL